MIDHENSPVRRMNKLKKKIFLKKEYINMIDHENSPVRRKNEP